MEIVIPAAQSCVGGFPGGQVVKIPPAKTGDAGQAILISGFKKIPWRRKWQPTSVLLLRKILRTEEAGGVQSMGSQRVGHD